MKPFLVLGLPRSRTAWLSRFLTYGDVICGHDELRHCRSMDDVRSWFAQGLVGSAETAAAPFWRLFDKIAPDVQIVVVRRSVEDVVESLMALPGVVFDMVLLTHEMRKLDRKLDQIEARADNVLSVQFDDLVNEATCRAVFHHCLPHEWNQAHWQFWAPVNVQCDFRAVVRYVEAHRTQLGKLTRIAKHEMLATMAMRKAAETDGVTIQTEPFETWLKDAPKLFDSHLVLVGEAPGDWAEKNIPMMRRLDREGAMQITTARCNGRMFGYLMTLLSPSLVSPELTSGTNLTFYADPSIPGLGMKIQRAALRTLKDRGVGEVFFEAGKRGSGERLGAMYRRLGAQDHGQVFRMALGA